MKTLIASIILTLAITARISATEKHHENPTIEEADGNFIKIFEVKQIQKNYQQMEPIVKQDITSETSTVSAAQSTNSDSNTVSSANTASSAQSANTDSNTVSSANTASAAQSTNTDRSHAVSLTSAFSSTAQTFTTRSTTVPQNATTSYEDIYVWLVISTSKTVGEVEAELERQFDQLFADYCSDPAQDNDTCSAYLTTAAVARAAQRADFCYDVIIRAFVETSRCADCKEMLVAVNFMCGSGSGSGSAPVPIPSTILASYFNETSSSYDSMQIVSAQPASDIKDTFTTTTPKQPEIQTVTVIDEGFMIATIVLGVLLGVALLILLAIVLYSCYKEKTKKSEIGALELQLQHQLSAAPEGKTKNSQSVSVEISARPTESDPYGNSATTF